MVANKVLTVFPILSGNWMGDHIILAVGFRSCSAGARVRSRSNPRGTCGVQVPIFVWSRW